MDAGREGVKAMDDQTESGEKILTSDVSDEALERAASAERQAFALTATTGTTATGRSSVQRTSSGSLAILAAIRRASMAKIGRAATVMSNRVSVSLPTAAAQCFGRRLALCRSWRNYRRGLCP